MINNILFCTLSLLLALTFPGSAKAKPPLIVNIDNPDFRKLVIAIPDFAVEDGASDSLKQLAQKGANELGRLLNFSGLFNIMASAAYKDILSKAQAGSKQKAVSKELEGVDLLQWKAIGVESLTVGELKQNEEGMSLALRTIDIYKGNLILGKQYSRIELDQFDLVLRRYADHLLQAYTGKPGIFSSRIVFVGRKSKSAFKQVFLCDFDGTNVKQITDHKSPHLSPVFSSDGKFVTYTSFQDGNPDLFIYEISTGKKRKLSGRKGLNSGSHWAPNGKLLAFTGSHEGDSNIYTITPKGGEAKVLIRGPGVDVDPRFSPDGKYLTFVSGRFGNPHIFLATLKWDGDESLRVTGDKRLTYAGWYNATPSWSPDSNKIAFAGYDRDTDRFDLFLMDQNGKNLERLTIRAGDNESPTWSPNGQMLVFQSNRTKGRDVKSVYQLYVMGRDGSGQRTLFTGLYESQTPDWGPALD